MGKFYVTTPIYYVNDEPHIGHAYTTILADVLSRYHRLFGDDVYFLTGTDEHGQKLQEAAKKNDLPTQEFCDQMAERFKKVWNDLNISNDDFIRTTEERHKIVVQKILQNIYDKGEIYTADYEGWYCVFEERFWTEKDLIDGTCPDCHRPVTKITEKNYFFKMSKYQDWLIKYILDNPNFILPDFRRNEVLGFLKQPLGDLCISRPKSRLSWGIELPFDKDYVCYVWFDALINYISAIGYLVDDVKFNKWWPAVHLIGKDILTTHAVYWPCMLQAIGIKQPETIFAHGWWLSGETKMSKSIGNVIKPLDLVNKHGVDAFRYFLVREMTLGQDSSYSEESFISRYNSDLANDLGNLLSRVIKMIQTNRNGIIPSFSSIKTFERAYVDLIDAFYKTIWKAKQKINNYQLNLLVADIMEFVKETNRFIDKYKPWDLTKKSDEFGNFSDSDYLNTILFAAAESLRLISILLSPIMPKKCDEIRYQLGINEDDASANKLEWGALDAEIKIRPGPGLFPRTYKKNIKANVFAKVEKASVKVATNKEEIGSSSSDIITSEYFGKIQFVTAKVLSAEKVQGADKLLKLQIDLGAEQRQIVAGVAQYYSPEDIVGKTIIVLKNLKPAIIRGIESNGMLLAAKSGDKLVLLTADKDIPPGAKIS